MPRSQFCSSPRIIHAEAKVASAAHAARNTFRHALLFAISLLVVASLAATAFAQSTTGSVYGQITDPSNAIIVGAKVTATNQATGVTYPGSSDSQGNYAVFNLLPGIYKVSVEKDGFETATINNVRIVIDQKQLLNFQLKIGAVATVEVVTAAPTMLQTETAETGEVIQSHDILNLPLNGRVFYDLTLLTAGVTYGSGNTNAYNFSINGQREYANSIQIDGVESTTNRTQDITVTPSVDAVEEFKVATSAYSAEFGRAAGGVVSIQTKSGTNQYHGSAYEFFRPNFTAAKSYGIDGNYEPPSILKQHNYGGTIGGPIIKNKTFFFFSYEGMKRTTSYDYLYWTLPKNLVKFLPDGSVDLSGLLDPYAGKSGVPSNWVTPIYDPAVMVNCYGGCPSQFPGNIIPANRVSQAGVNMFNDFWPSPNLPGTENGWSDNFQVHSPVDIGGKNIDGRLDHTFSDKDRLSVLIHYADGNTMITDPYWGHTVVQGGGDADQANHEVYQGSEDSISEDHLFSPRFLNEVRLGYTRYVQNQYSLLNGQDLSTKYGVGNIHVPGYPATDGFPWIYMGGDYTLVGGSTYKPFIITDNNYQLTDNVILSSVGKHEIKFGGDFRRLQSHPLFSLFPTGFFYFAGPYAAMTSDWSYSSPLDNYSAFFGTGGADIADLLMGLPLDVQIGLQLSNPHTRSWEMAYYVQDTYKMTPRLTLNYGIRYEYQAPFTDAQNNMANYDIATNSFLLAGRGANSPGLINSRWNDFGPRLGVAYQADPKLVVRAGYGFYYSPENDGREDILTKNYPFAYQQTFTSNPYYGPCSGQPSCYGPFSYYVDQGSPRSTSIPIPPGASSIPSSAITNGNLLTSNYVVPTLKTGYSQLYNLSVEQELGRNFTVEAGYVGSISHDLSYRVGDINRLDPVSGNPALTPDLGKIQALYNSGFAVYHSLQVKVTKRVSKNLNFLTSYTYGHNIDNGPSPWNIGGNNDYPQNPYNLRAERASADGDIRHNLVFSGIYRLPFGRGQEFFANWNRVEDLALGGWQLNGIFSAHTGTPFNIIRASYTPGYEGLRPDQVGDPNLPRSQRTLDKYFNTAAFSTAAFTGTNLYGYGDAGRNPVYGPGFISADVSLFKDFSVLEHATLQTRFEFFNVTNTPHFSNPIGDMSSSQFGEIRSAGDMRVVQAAVKVLF
jgi:hypothetical protein